MPLKTEDNILIKQVSTIYFSEKEKINHQVINTIAQDDKFSEVTYSKGSAFENSK